MRTQPHADRQSVLAQITLCIPWLAPSDQAIVFNNISFERPEQQEEYVREWARKRTGLPCDFQIRFYPGRYAVEKCSILPVGDPTSYISDKEVRRRTRVCPRGKTHAPPMPEPFPETVRKPSPGRQTRVSLNANLPERPVVSGHFYRAQQASILEK